MPIEYSRTVLVETATHRFHQFASVSNNNERFLNPQDFARAMTPDDPEKALNLTHPESTYSLLFKLADTKKKGLLDVNDFIEFETLLFRPDAEFVLAFRLLDEANKGFVTYGQLKKSLSTHLPSGAPSMDFSADNLRLFVGGKGNGDDDKNLTFTEFSQFVRNYKQERLSQEFKFYDKSQSGAISAKDLKHIMTHIAKHRLSDSILDNLHSLSIFSPASISAGEKITFPVAQAVFNVSQQLDGIRAFVSNFSKSDGTVSKQEFVDAVMASGSNLTPLEVEVIFHLIAEKTASPTTRVPLSSFDKLVFPSFGKVTQTTAPVTQEAAVATSSGSKEVLKSIYNFALGSVAGAVGATVVYPIDLVKTRMQNQRSSKFVGQLLYKNSFDCFKKVVKNEGVRGLYSGLLPQLVGVAPEKAIKLTMNDLVRSIFKDKQTGDIHFAAEVLAGCTAGGSQVIFTNPLEIVKIRLQVQGEAANGAESVPKQSAFRIVRQLGLFGLYKGAGACLLRDIPFSGIYFPVYAHLKKDVFDEGKNGKKLAGYEMLVSGAIAGIPAAYLVTPADVIKTRLQVAARKGETTYTGITDAFVKIMKEEGPRAFFKGGLARVFRSSPQFGVTLWAYEALHNLFPLDLDGTHKHDKVNAYTRTEGMRLEAVAEAARRNALRTVIDLMPKLNE